MLPIVWMESFSEEEETVKRVSSLNNEILFFEDPVQQLDPSDLPQNYIASIRTHSRFNRKTGEAVSCVISRSTGYDHLVEQKDILSDIPTGHLSEYATDAVAEHNLTISLALLKHLNRQQSATEDFSRDNLTGYDLQKRTVGIVGIGNIGESTANRFMNLGLTVKGHDIRQKDHLIRADRFAYCSLSKLFESSDLVVLCLPHTPETDGMITLSLLRSMPEKSFLVNAGRGEVVSLKDLKTALEEGPLEGLGLDVYNREDRLSRRLSGRSAEPSEDPEVEAGRQLIQDERVIATPHNAFNTWGALETKVRLTLENIQAFNNGQDLVNPVA